MKQGSHEQVCSECHANLTLGDQHDPDCDYAARVDPWAEESDEQREEEDEDGW